MHLIYVYWPKLNNTSIKSAKAIIKYITRYASHPAISERRIISYDKEKGLVTWFYDPHEDDDIECEEDKLGRQVITEHVFDFMKRLIIHIHDRYFHQIRYYGFYSNNSSLERTSSLFTKEQIKVIENDTLWINGLLKSFGYTPLICPICGETMLLSLKDSYFPKKKGLSL